jgi:hypothetical protein
VLNTGSGVAVGGNLNGDVNVTKEIHADIPEVIKQHEFEKVIGIMVSGQRECKELDRLAAIVGRNAIKAARKGGSLQWDKETQSLTAILPPGEEKFGAALVSAPMLFWTFHIFPRFMDHGELGVIYIALFFVLCVGASRLIYHAILYPRKVALELVERAKITIKPFVSPLQRAKKWLKARLS